LGCANIIREGTDVTILATGAQVSRAIQAADRLKDEGVIAEVIDPRTLNPLDEDTIFSSVRKTGHLVVVHEAWERGGHGGEIAALVSDKAFNSLKGPIKRVAAKNTPSPFSPKLEQSVLPQVDDIVRAALDTLAFKA
jgi:pyruvate dehydrogenase E1 component beta subunit